MNKIIKNSIIFAIAAGICLPLNAQWYLNQVPKATPIQENKERHPEETTESRSALLSEASAAFSKAGEDGPDKTVTLMAFGEGPTKDSAVASALRSAIEQAYGTFVSANTDVLNDDLLKDETVTVTSGSIKKYNEISCVNLPDGNTSVSLKATVSIGSLVSYAKSHGASTELAGKEFAMQMKIEKINIENEERALHHMISELYALLPSLFDYSIEVKNISMVTTSEAQVDAVVNVLSNDTAKSFYQVIESYLRGLSLVTGSMTPNTYHYNFKGSGYTLRTDRWPFFFEILLNQGVLRRIYGFDITTQDPDLVLGKVRLIDRSYNQCELPIDLPQNSWRRSELNGTYMSRENFLNLSWGGGITIDGLQDCFLLKDADKYYVDKYYSGDRRAFAEYIHTYKPFVKNGYDSSILFPFPDPSETPIVYSIPVTMVLSEKTMEQIDELRVSPIEMEDIVIPALYNQCEIDKLYERECYSWIHATNVFGNRSWDNTLYTTFLKQRPRELYTYFSDRHIFAPREDVYYTVEICVDQYGNPTVSSYRLNGSLENDTCREYAKRLKEEFSTFISNIQFYPSERNGVPVTSTFSCTVPLYHDVQL